MKVHGKDAICHFDSEESDEETSSPPSSLVSGHTPLQPQHMGDWYNCHQPNLPTPPSDHPHHSPGGHTNPVKFESHHSIGGLIGSGY